MAKLRTVYEKLNKHFGRLYWWPVISKNIEFEIITGAILTQNTSWTNVENAISNLYNNKILDAEKIKKTNKQRLAKIIRPAGYYNQKSEKLKIAARFFSKEKIDFFKDNSNIKELRNTLLDIKGIGPETADSILLYAFKKPVFVIDAYTKRIFSRFGICDENITYNNLQDIFMDNLPHNHKLFNQYHALIVEHAKNFCKKKPLCPECPLKHDCKANI